MGQKMDYHVAVEDSNFMATGWIEASGQQGIPVSYVVNAEGRLVWIGPPTDLDQVLPNIVNNTWNIKEAFQRRNENKRLQELDREAGYTLLEYKADRSKPSSVDRPDSALLVINEMIRKEPKLKYAPFVASYTFSFLLQTDPHKAYQYGKEVLVNPTYEAPATNAIISNIYWYSDKINMPAEIYELGAEAYQTEIDQIVYPELVDISKLYNTMADLYWRANNKTKAIDAQQKAVERLKDKHAKEMAEFQSRLQQYKNM